MPFVWQPPPSPPPPAAYTYHPHYDHCKGLCDDSLWRWDLCLRLEEGEMANVIAEIKRMVADSSMDEFLAAREALRRQHGQATFVIARKPQS